jgi:hypothetical protein
LEIDIDIVKYIKFSTNGEIVELLFNVPLNNFAAVCVLSLLSWHIRIDQKTGLNSRPALHLGQPSREIQEIPVQLLRIIWREDSGRKGHFKI